MREEISTQGLLTGVVKAFSHVSYHQESFSPLFKYCIWPWKKMSSSKLETNPYLLLGRNKREPIVHTTVFQLCVAWNGDVHYWVAWQPHGDNTPGSHCSNRDINWKKSFLSLRLANSFSFVFGRQTRERSRMVSPGSFPICVTLFLLNSTLRSHWCT